MFDRVVIRATDLAASLRFYATVLPELGGPAALTAPGPDGQVAPDLAVVAADPGSPTTRILHVGLAAASRAHVDAFWQAGIDAGFTGDGPPGPRPVYADDYYGAFLLDPDGNSIEAVHDRDGREDGLVDHVWVRVLNAAMTARFLEATSAQAGAGRPAYAMVDRGEGFAHFRGPRGGSLRVLDADEPTVGLDLTIGAARLLDDDGRSLKLRPAG